MSKKRVTNPHDKFFKAVFSYTEVAEGFIVNFLDKKIQEAIDLSTLELQSESFIDEDLKTSFSDILYKVKAKNEQEIYLSFLFEHKSYLDDWIFQLLKYMNNRWIQLRKENRTVDLIIPIVVYHGDKSSEYQKLSNLIQCPSDFFKRFIPDFEYYLVDVTQFSEEQLLQINDFIKLRNAMMALKFARDEQYVLNHFEKIFWGSEEYFHSYLGANFFNQIFVYIGVANEFDEVEILHIFSKLHQPLKEFAMTTYDQIVQKGVNRGIEQGIEKGIEQGREKAKTSATKKMLKEGISVEMICKVLDVTESFISECQEL